MHPACVAIRLNLQNWPFHFYIAIYIAIYIATYTATYTATYIAIYISIYISTTWERLLRS